MEGISPPLPSPPDAMEASPHISYHQSEIELLKNPFTFYDPSNSKPFNPKSQKRHVSLSDRHPRSKPFIRPAHLICAPEGAGEQKWQTLS
jgi:hypothetical protein